MVTHGKPYTIIWCVSLPWIASERHMRMPEGCCCHSGDYILMQILWWIVEYAYWFTGNMHWGYIVFPSNIYQVPSGRKYGDVGWDSVNSPVTLDCFENNIRLSYMYSDPQEIIPSSIISFHWLDSFGKVSEDAGKVLKECCQHSRGCLLVWGSY